MKNQCLAIILAFGAIAAAAQTQTPPLPLPPAVEKELASRASDVTEVTLGKSMLAFASKFMNGKDQDEAATRQLITGLDGIYVRDYEFDKEGQYSMDEIEQLRKYFETSEWSPIVRERERKTGETTDVMVKLVNGESHGMFILTAEPKELTIVLILGPIKMEDLSKLKGLSGLGSLGDISVNIKDKDKDKDKEKNKDKTKAKEMSEDKKDGAQ
ncbi:MAG: DUF4252 domain-containing protein [Terracidiphilus sp.]|jgi:hypothetical protein